ncbi:MAG: thioredoxin domain-containing protein [Anaerolineae bacterium]
MSRKHNRAARAQQPQPAPAPTDSAREIVVKPIHLILGTVIIVALALLIFVGLPRLIGGQPSQSVASAPAAPIAPSAGGNADVPPGAVQFENGLPVQPGGMGSASANAQLGQVVYPSGANRPDSTPEGFPMEGAADAPITILEFADFQSLYSKPFATDTLPMLRQKWFPTGKVRLIWRDLALSGPESEAAGAAALCAHEQGRFWPYHDMLFARQKGQNGGAFSADNLKALAKDVGRMNLDLFNKCLDSGRYLPAVRASTLDAQNKQISNAPTFFVNGKKVEGTLDPATWDDMLRVGSGG